MSPRTGTPPRCGRHRDEEGREWPGCGAPGAWAWRGSSKRDAKWTFIDAELSDGTELSPEERLEKIPFDDDLHVQHRCREHGPEQPAAVLVQAPTGISARVYLAGQALGYMLRSGNTSPFATPAILAENAVQIADAILAELEKA